MKMHIASARVLAAAGILLVGLALVIAGCGGGSSSTSSSGSTEASESSGGGATESSGGSEESSSSETAFPAAAKANEEFEERPTTVGIEAPVGKPIPEGKTIDFIQCGVPACKTEGELFEEAAEPLGWTIDDEDVEDIWWSATISRR